MITPDEVASLLAQDRPEWRVTVDGARVTIEDPRFGSTVVWELDAGTRRRLRRREAVDRRMAEQGLGRGSSGRAMFVVSLEEKLDTFTGRRGRVEVDDHGALHVVDDSPG